jgi:hypothetical protein
MSFKTLKAAFGRFYDLPEDATKRDVEDRINLVAQQDPEVRLYARDLTLYTIARELSELRRQIGRVVKDDLTPMGSALDAIADVVEGLGERLQDLAADELGEDDEPDDAPDIEDQRPTEPKPTAEPEEKPARAPRARNVDAPADEAKPARAPRARKADAPAGEAKPRKRGNRGEIVVTDEATP